MSSLESRFVLEGVVLFDISNVEFFLGFIYEVFFLCYEINFV